MSSFTSIFKINNKPIMPPVIDENLRKEIKRIREIVKQKELIYQRKLKEAKDHQNTVKQSELVDSELRQRRNSYTEFSPTFDSEILPKISAASSESSEKDTIIDGPVSLQSEDVSEYTEKSSKDLQNEIDKRSAGSLDVSNASSKINVQLKDLIEKQKREYLNAMEALKNKFTSEQHDLLMKFQSSLVTSTPLDTSVMTCGTEDEEFTEFKTCLQSQSQSLEEKTIVNDADAKWKASIIINTYARGFLVRRLMKTIYVQEHVRNIQETLQLVLNLNDHSLAGSPVQNILLKAKLFRQLQSDLYNFSEIFIDTSIKERMEIISADREIRMKKESEKNSEEMLSLSFQSVV